MRFFIFIKNFVFVLAVVFTGALANTDSANNETQAANTQAVNTATVTRDRVAAYLAQNLDLERNLSDLIAKAVSQRDFATATLLTDIESQIQEKATLLADYLKENNLDSKESKEALLFEAVKQGDVETALLLLRLGVDANARRNGFSTPLHVTVQGRDREGSGGSSEMARLLIAHGANVQLPDNMGRPPLHWAAEYGYFKVAEVLIAHGANVNITSNLGRTALHIGLESLLDCCIHNGKRTGMHLFWPDEASVSLNKGKLKSKLSKETENSIRVIALLLYHGADSSLRDRRSDERSPFDYIQRINHLAIRSFLQELIHNPTLLKDVVDGQKNLRAMINGHYCQRAIRGA